MRPLEETTKDISSEKLVTMSLCIPIVYGRKEEIDKYEPGTGLGYNIQSKLLTEIEKKLGQTEKSHGHAAATLMDPCFKVVDMILKILKDISSQDQPEDVVHRFSGSKEENEAEGDAAVGHQDADDAAAAHVVGGIHEMNDVAANVAGAISQRPAHAQRVICHIRPRSTRRSVRHTVEKHADWDNYWNEHDENGVTMVKLNKNIKY